MDKSSITQKRYSIGRWVARTATSFGYRFGTLVAGQMTDPLAGVDEFLMGLDDGEFNELRRATGDLEARWVETWQDEQELYMEDRWDR